MAEEFNGSEEGDTCSPTTTKFNKSWTDTLQLKKNKQKKASASSWSKTKVITPFIVQKVYSNISDHFIVCCIYRLSELLFLCRIYHFAGCIYRLYVAFIVLQVVFLILHVLFIVCQGFWSIER